MDFLGLCGFWQTDAVERAAHPYDDTSVIDARAPRFNQAVVGIGALVAITLGPCWCLPCLAYFELVQPRFGEGPLEDARPPRFANLVGVSVLGAATAAHALGWQPVGTGLGALVAALALLAAVTGFCAGCEAYKLGHLLTGRRFESCPLPPRPEPAARSL